MPDQPPISLLYIQNIPTELKELNQWVGWFWKKLGKKWTKVPQSLKDHQLASSDNPDTWASFSVTTGRDRIGFMFSAEDPYCGIDIDSCVDPATGKINRTAQNIIDAFSSYSEISPSGTGVKIFVKGSLPGPRRKNPEKNIEMYDSGRFFTLTGNRLEDAPNIIEDRQKQIEKLYKWLFPKAESSEASSASGVSGNYAGLDLSDEDILSKAFRAKNGDKFFRLWNGEIADYGSHSEADLALASMISFWTGPDVGRIERLFSESGLNRGKWQQRATYRRTTIEKVLKGATEFYSFGGSPGEEPQLNTKDVPFSKNGKRTGLSTFTALELSNKEFPPINWIVPGLVPAGTMLLAGKPKMCKSWLALQLCIAVATGGKALQEIEVEQGEALYLALEDNERRLQDRIAKLMVGREAPDGLHMTTFSNRVDSGLLEDLEEFLEAHEDIRLVVIDTMVKVRPQSSNRQTLYEQDYEAVSALTDLAGQYNVAILLVHHLKKGDADDIMDLVSGSTGLTGGVDGTLVLNRTRSAADAVLTASHRDVKDDPELALAWDKERAVWKLIGDAEEYRLSKERREILEVLSNADEAMRPQDIAEALDKLTPNISKLLQKMREDGYVDNEGYGKYVIAKGALAPPTIQTIQTIQVEPEVKVGSLGSLGMDLEPDEERF